MRVASFRWTRFAELRHVARVFENPRRDTMRTTLIAACVLTLPALAIAQSHTLVALSHSDHTAYELDPATGKVLHQFTAVNEPHEGVASPDGKIFYAAVPNGPH